jgi:acetoin utilization deacetylase AcuC-like enzyme
VGGGELEKNQRLLDLNEVSQVHDQHWLRVLEAMEAAWETALTLDPEAWEQLVGPAMGRG